MNPENNPSKELLVSEIIALGEIACKHAKDLCAVFRDKIASLKEQKRSCDSSVKYFEDRAVEVQQNLAIAKADSAAKEADIKMLTEAIILLASVVGD